MQKQLLACLVVGLMSSVCLGGFGGSRSSGSFSSGRSSSSSSFGGARSSFSSQTSRSSFSATTRSSTFGGSRSSSATGGATIIRNSAPPVTSSISSSSTHIYSSPMVNHTTVIHSGPSMWDYMWWHSLFYHEPVQTVIVAGQNQMAPGVLQPGTVMVQQPVHGFFYYLFCFVSGCLFLLIVVAVIGAMIGG